MLSCLARKPGVRPSAAALSSTLHKLLAASSATAVAAAPPAAAAAEELGAPRAAPAAAAAAAPAGGPVVEVTASSDASRAVDKPSEFSDSFLRAPLTRMHEQSSAVVATDSTVAGYTQVDGALRVGPSGLAVSGVRSVSDGGTYEEDTPSAMDTLDNSGSFKALAPTKPVSTVASGDLVSQALRSELSVTAAMW